MFRAITTAVTRNAACLARTTPQATVSAVRTMSAHAESPEQFDQRFIDYFNRADIDGWEVRKAMTELNNADLIPEPKVVAAGLRACRRVNDYALAVRFLESVMIKCGSKKHVEQVYPWIIQEITPVLKELGISTPEEMGYDKPEYWIPQPDWWWERDWYKVYGFDKKPGYNF